MVDIERPYDNNYLKVGILIPLIICCKINSKFVLFWVCFDLNLSIS